MSLICGNSVCQTLYTKLERYICAICCGSCQGREKGTRLAGSVGWLPTYTYRLSHPWPRRDCDSWLSGIIEHITTKLIHFHHQTDPLPPPNWSTSTTKLTHFYHQTDPLLPPNWSTSTTKLIHFHISDYHHNHFYHQLIFFHHQFTITINPSLNLLLPHYHIPCRWTVRYFASLFTMRPYPQQE